MREYLPVLTDEMKSHDIESKKIAMSKPIEVRKYSELVSQISELAYKNKDVLLFFRGQHRDYLNKSNSSTFYPTIYRGDYLKSNEVEYKFSLLNEACDLLKMKFKSANINGYNELRRKIHIQWSILQHYEVCDTPLIDITHSIRVACSFAYNENKNNKCYFYAFGLPYLTNRISNNSEHDLVTIRLLSISPPQAKRPYFQEGYLAGTSDVTTNYENKTELDLRNRLVAKFTFENSDTFWDHGERPISNEYIYPENDFVNDLCKDIVPEVKKGFFEGEIGDFISLWSDFEDSIRFDNKINTVNNYINNLKKEKKVNNKIYTTLQDVRMFRNNVIHDYKNIDKGDIKKYEVILRDIIDEMNI